MAFVRPRARVLEISTTAGSGPYALAGAVDGSYNTFASFMAIGDTTYCSVVEPGVAFWTGLVTYSAAGEITLTTVEETKGTFGAGTKEIFPGALASTGAFREDISGAIVTGGSSTAYTVASYRDYDTLTRLDGNILAFTPHVTNGQTVTLSVDGLAAKPLRAAPASELMPGVLIQGTPYLVLYNHSDQVFYLHGLFGNPHNVPLAAGMDYWAATTPNSAFAFPAGQAISRTAYPGLWNLIGTTYGLGDGSTTFNLPNKAGKISAMKEATATLLTTAGGGVDGGTLGAGGGSQNVTPAANQIPSLASTGNNSITVLVSGGKKMVSYGSPSFVPVASAGALAAVYDAGGSGNLDLNITSLSGNNAISVNYTNASQVPIKTLPPMIVCNYIMRII